MSVRFIWSIGFKFTDSLLIFCLNNLSIIESGVLKSLSVFRYINICFILLSLLMLSVYIYKCYISLLNLLLWYYVMTFFVSYDTFRLKVYFIYYQYSYSSFLCVTICMKYLFPSIHFQLMCVFKCKMSLLQTNMVGSCVFFFF